MSILLFPSCRRELQAEISHSDRSAAVSRARERFGQPFVHEAGSTWHPRATPLLTEWLSKREALK